MGGSLGRAELDLDVDASGLDRGLDQAHRKTQRFGADFQKQMGAMGAKLTAAGRTLTMGLTLPIVGMGFAAVKSFADFDAAMTQSTAIMGDLSDAMRDKLERAAKDVAKTTKFSAKEAAESYFFLASAGLDAATSLEALPKVAAFAQAGMFDMARATDLLTDAQSALGLTIRDDAVANMENMVRVSDALVKANILSNATVEQFSESLTNKAGAALRLVNKDIEEGLAVLAAFADQGVKGAEAGERLNIALRDLQTAAIKNREEFAKHNIAVFDSSGNLRNMADIVDDLEGALEGMSDEQVRTTLMTLGFQDRSVSALMTLLGLSDAIRNYEKQLRDAGGTTQTVAEKQMEAFNEKLRLLKNRLQVAIIPLGKELADIVLDLAPAIEGMAGGLERILVVFQRLPKPVKAVIIGFFGILALIGPLLLIAGAFARALVSLAGAGEVLGPALGKIGRVVAFLVKPIQLLIRLLLFGLSALATAFGLPVAVVAAIVAAIAVGVFLIIKHWDTLVRFFTQTVPTFFTQTLPGWIKTGVEAVVRFFSELPGKAAAIAAQVLSAVANWFIQLPGRLGFYAGLAVGTVIRHIALMPVRIAQILLTIIPIIFGFGVAFVSWAFRTGGDVLAAIVGFLVQLPGRVARFLVAVVGKFIDLATQAPSWARRAAQAALDGFVSIITGLPGIVGGIIGRTIDAFKQMVGAAFQAAKNFAAGLWDGFKAGLGVGSPSLIELSLFSIQDTMHAVERDLRMRLPRLDVVESVIFEPPAARPGPPAAVGDEGGRPIVNVSLMLDPSAAPGSLDAAVLTWLRKTIRVEGGDVQEVLGL